MSMDALIGEVLGQVRTIASDVLRREGTRLRTATVTSSSPTRIRYDGEDDPSVVTPRSVVRVSTGQRVVVAKSRGQATILGAFGNAGWQPLTLYPNRGTASHGQAVEILREGKRRTVRGRIERTAGSALFDPAEGFNPFILLIVPTADRPAGTWGGFGNVSLFTNPGFARLEISSSGELSAGPSKATSWIGIDNFTWTVD